MPCATPKRAFLVITHYQRLLNHIVPDSVHVMANGRIVRSGGKELALELERTAMRTIVSRPRHEHACRHRCAQPPRRRFWSASLR